MHSQAFSAPHPTHHWVAWGAQEVGKGPSRDSRPRWPKGQCSLRPHGQQQPLGEPGWGLLPGACLGTAQLLLSNCLHCHHFFLGFTSLFIVLILSNFYIITITIIIKLYLSQPTSVLTFTLLVFYP